MNRLKLATASLLALTFTAAPLAAKPTLHRAAARSPGAAFTALSARYLTSLARLNPVKATTLGDHRFDALLPDISSRGRATEGAEWRTLLAQLRAIPRTQLSREAQVDWLLLENDLNYRLWSSASEQAWAWDPQVYSGTASSALYSLAARDFADRKSVV